MFSRFRTPSSGGSPAAARSSSGSATFSVLGSDVEVMGNIAATVDLHIDGRVDGDIRCAALIQGAGSRIAGAITAESARLAGTVEGSIDAKQLIIERTARILGDVAYEEITIEPGGHIQGRFMMRGGQLLAGEIETPLKLVGAAGE